MTFTRGFPVSEFEARVQAAQRMMRDAQLDALLYMTEREFTYFAGFQSNFWQSPTRPWFLIIPADGKPIAVIPSIGENALKISWLDDVRIWASPNPQDEGISLLADTLKTLAQRHARRYRSRSATAAASAVASRPRGHWIAIFIENHRKI